MLILKGEVSLLVSHTSYQECSSTLIEKNIKIMCVILYNECALITHFRYMHRRCEFLDNCPSFNFNRGLSVPNATDTSQLGSTLMRAMLTEVADFCSPEIQKNWSCKPHQQVTSYTSIEYCTVSIVDRRAYPLIFDSVINLSTIQLTLFDFSQILYMHNHFCVADI